MLGTLSSPESLSTTLELYHGIQLNSVQRWFIDLLEQRHRQGQPIRYLVLKARGVGLSSAIQLYFAWLRLHNPGLKIVTMSHTYSSARGLYCQYYQFASRLGVEDHDLGIWFESYSTVSYATQGMGPFDLIHADISAMRHFYSSLLPIDTRPDSVIIFEMSSPGPSVHFRQMWEAARAGQTTFFPVFVPWFLNDLYTSRTTPKEDLAWEELKLSGFRGPSTLIWLADDELELARRFNLSFGQIKWRREMIDWCGSERIFRRDFPSVPEEAFEEV